MSDDGFSDEHTAGGIAGGKADTRLIGVVWKREAPRIIGNLSRILRDLSLAEEFAQDALVEALERWPRAGLPDNPGAWLMVTAKNRALNALRRGRFFVELGRKEHAAEPHTTLDEVEAALMTSDEPVQDDVLRLLFVACHPVLTQESRVALTLRTVAGLSTGQIARAFLSIEPTMAQRLSRGRKTLADAGVPFELPAAAELGARLASVLEVVYLIFNEGYSATEGPELVRADLCDEALRLGELLVNLAPAEPEAHALLALMRLTHARAAARVDDSGAPVLLADQDRGRWDREAIERGLAALSNANALGTEANRPPGPYALQAEIAACHARARTFAETNWRAITDWYALLSERTPSPVVALNRALALSRAEGPEVGLAALYELAALEVLRTYHPLPAARAELLEALGRFDEAAEAFAAAAALASHPRQQQRLRERAEAARGRGRILS